MQRHKDFAHPDFAGSNHRVSSSLQSATTALFNSKSTSSIYSNEDEKLSRNSQEHISRVRSGGVPGVHILKTSNVTFLNYEKRLAKRTAQMAASNGTFLDSEKRRFKRSHDLFGSEDEDLIDNSQNPLQNTPNLLQNTENPLQNTQNPSENTENPQQNTQNPNMEDNAEENNSTSAERLPTRNISQEVQLKNESDTGNQFEIFTKSSREILFVNQNQTIRLLKPTPQRLVRPRTSHRKRSKENVKKTPKVPLQVLVTPPPVYIIAVDLTEAALNQVGKSFHNI